MRHRLALLFATALVIAGLAAVPDGLTTASAATCPSTYVDAPPCGGATSTATATVGVNAGVAGPAARVGTRCTIAALKRAALLTVSTPGGVVSGGTLQATFHRVGSPGSTKRKLTLTSYSQSPTKRLRPGLWHGTMVYRPDAGSKFQYCGIVFRNLRIAKPAHRRHASAKVPTSVSAGLRTDAS